MNWEAEASGLIADIKRYVVKIEIVSSSSQHACFDIETLEKQRFNVHLDSKGFTICDTPTTSRQGHDIPTDNQVYETIYGLLSDVSAGYRVAFASALTQKINQLGDNE